jgi:hypothetical protein
MISLRNKRLGALAAATVIGVGGAAVLPGAAIAASASGGAKTTLHDRSPDKRSNDHNKTDKGSIDRTRDR